MSDTAAYDTIDYYATMKGQIMGILKGYERWGISAEETIKRIDEVVNKERKDE